MLRNKEQSNSLALSLTHTAVYTPRLHGDWDKKCVRGIEIIADGLQASLAVLPACLSDRIPLCYHILSPLFYPTITCLPHPPPFKRPDLRSGCPPVHTLCLMLHPDSSCLVLCMMTNNPISMPVSATYKSKTNKCVNVAYVCCPYLGMLLALKEKFRTLCVYVTARAV